MASETMAKIDRARVVVAEINYGKREWKGLHEPASEDATDVVIMEALRCAALEISRLSRELEAALEREQRLREALERIGRHDLTASGARDVARPGRSHGQGDER